VGIEVGVVDDSKVGADVKFETAVGEGVLGILVIIGTVVGESTPA
jgi:hypothetical protein